MSNFRYDTEWHDNDKDDIHASIMAWDYDVKIEYVKEDGSTDCSPYDSDKELLREILDVYNHAVKHKEMYDSERSES